MARYKAEVNPMSHYFSSDSNMGSVLRIVRGGLQEGVCRKIGSQLIERAASDARRKKANIDASTHPYSHDINTYRYGGEPRVVVLVDGRFSGVGGDIDTVIASDLGYNPHELFEGRFRGRTIDTDVTIKQATGYIEDNLEAIHKAGFDCFEVTRSRFFYFRKGSIKRFLVGDELDMARLVPLITPTPGHVGIEAVETPTFDEYIQSAPLFNSYRLKESLTRKILRRLGSKKVSGEITDWVAHRRILATKEDVYNLESLLSGSPRLRESQIEHISTKDNHENPPPSGYGGLKVVVVVTTKGYDPCVREIQIVDREQYYRNEFEPGISSHDAHERRQRHVSRARRQVYEYYRGILEEIFGSDKLLVDIK